MALCISCNNKKNYDSKVKTDYVDTELDNDSSSVSDMDDYDWTPEGFKSEHHDEWVVVKQSIGIQQREEKIDFSKIDKLVKDYIKAKNIELPTDKYRQIEKIDDICYSKFDISGYDDSNMGMHIADGTRHLFYMYINWLYQQEAENVLSKKPIIDIKKEFNLYDNLNDAMYDLCDSVAFCMGGSGGWMASSQIQELSNEFKRCMFQAVIISKIDKKKKLVVSLEMFDNECKALIDNYKPFKEEQLKDVTSIVNKFKTAFHIWYTYRKSTASELTDLKFKKAYESITYSYARIYFLHLKNRYSDIGLMSNDMSKLCLEGDCSNKELLEFNYENKWKELFGDFQ